MSKFRLETEVVNMDFFNLSEFDTNHDGALVRFEILPESYQQYWMSAFEVPPGRERYISTGKTTLWIEAANSQEAMDHGSRILYDHEHLLTLAHFHHVFFTGLKCFEENGVQPIMTRGLSGRVGREGTGCLLWPAYVPKFLNIALPSLDRVPGFRWGLYWFNELTALATVRLVQVEVPSLWNAFETMAASTATAAKMDTLLTNKEIEQVKEYLKPLLEKMNCDDEKRKQVYGHLGMLRRPPIMHSAELLLETYEPNSHEFLQYIDEVESFYKLRNSVVHNRNEELEGVDVGAKTFRFMRLLQKLLFCMAGIYQDAEAFKSPVKSVDLSAR